MSNLIQFPRLLILIVLVSYGTVCAVTFTPTFPLLAHEFNLSSADSQWMMTLFLFGSVLGRLPYGPLANAIGRKKALFVGFWISLAGALLCLCAPTYPILILGRWVQAIGSAAALTITYTMISDSHSGPKATRALSYVMVAFAIVPGVGTSISGYLADSMGWRGGFAFILAFTLLLMLLSLALPETGKEKDFSSLQVKKILRGYQKGFKDSSLILHGTLMGLSSALLFIFSQEAPFIATQFFGVTPAEYGLFYLIPSFGIAIGSFLTAWLACKADSRKSMIGGISLILIGVLTMGGCFEMDLYTGWALFLPQIIVQIGDALLYTNASSEALSDAGDKASASSIVLFMNGACSVVGTFFAGVFIPRVPLALPVTFLILTVLMLIVWLFLGRQRRSRAI